MTTSSSVTLTAVVPIYGPALDGTLPGNEVIIQSSVGNRVTYARAMGPMQFLPSTFAHYAVDGDGDGLADLMNPYDAIFTAASYLCANGAGRGGDALYSAIWHYNHADWYVQMVLALAKQYAESFV
jgi:membrane-bound lytic murein transglycosylase B